FLHKQRRRSLGMRRNQLPDLVQICGLVVVAHGDRADKRRAELTFGSANECELPAPRKLQTYWKASKAFPSMAKLADVLGLSSTASVFELVGKQTDRYGYLRRVKGRVALGLGSSPGPWWAGLGPACPTLSGTRLRRR